MASGQGILRYKIGREACLSPTLHQVGWASFNEPVHDAENLPAHTHETAYEICYIAHGTVDWWVEDRVFEVDPGTVFLTMPGERHGGLHDIMNPCELFWIQFELPEEGPLPGLTGAETASLADKFARIEQRYFPGLPTVPILFDQIVKEHRAPTDYSEMIIRTSLIELMICVIRSHEEQVRRGATESEHSRPIQCALQWIDQHVGHDLKVDEIAKQVGLSSTVFYKRFHEELHVTPGEYLTQRRIHKAKSLLADTSRSITDIAHSLGYSSSQYFATIFKKTTGVTPRAYRAAKFR